MTSCTRKLFVFFFLLLQRRELLLFDYIIKHGELDEASGSEPDLATAARTTSRGKGLELYFGIPCTHTDASATFVIRECGEKNVNPIRTHYDVVVSGKNNYFTLMLFQLFSSGEPVCRSTCYILVWRILNTGSMIRWRKTNRMRLRRFEFASRDCFFFPVLSYI